jgi:hypothetical protein
MPEESIILHEVEWSALTMRMKIVQEELTQPHIWLLPP